MYMIVIAYYCVGVQVRPKGRRVQDSIISARSRKKKKTREKAREKKAPDMPHYQTLARSRGPFFALPRARFNRCARYTTKYNNFSNITDIWLFYRVFHAYRPVLAKNRRYSCNLRGHFDPESLWESLSESFHPLARSADLRASGALKMNELQFDFQPGLVYTSNSLKGLIRWQNP